MNPHCRQRFITSQCQDVRVVLLRGIMAVVRTSPWDALKVVRYCCNTHITTKQERVVTQAVIASYPVLFVEHVLPA